MALTPGVLYLLAIVPNVLFPLCTHIVLRYLAGTYHLFSLSRPLVAFVWIFTLPVYWYIKAKYRGAVHGRQARRLGAKLAPPAQGKLPGNIDLLRKYFGPDVYLGDGFAGAMDELGTTFTFTLLGEYRLVTANPHNIKQVLATDFDNFEKGPLINKMLQSVLGVGVFNSDGNMWQFHRKMTRPFFAKDRVADYCLFDTKFSTALRKMQDRFDTGDAIDFQDVCGRFTIDSICDFLLGTSIDSLHDPLPRPGQDLSNIDTPSNKFLLAFADAQTGIAQRSRIGTSWPLFEIFKDRTQKDMQVVKGFIEPIVREAMRKREQNSVGEKDESLLQHLLDVTQDKNLIVDQTLNIILAGRDTTAGLLTFVAYCLAMHPEVLARLRDEIVAVVGTSKPPTYDDVRGMKYLRAVLNETLRLFPSVPLSSRVSKAPSTFRDDNGQDIFVPAGTRVTYAFIVSQRREAYWGKDAHLFDPDRFLDDRANRYIVPNPFVFVPFNAGPRICLGQQFAYQEASFFIIRLLQHFDSITLAPDCQPEYSKPPDSWRTSQGGTPRKAFEEMVPDSHLTMFAKGGLWLRMRPSKPTKEAC